MEQGLANLVISIKDDYLRFLKEYQGTVAKKKVEAVVTDFIVFGMQEEDLREDETIGLLKKEYKTHTSEMDKTRALIALTENVAEYSKIAMRRIAARKSYGLLGNQANLNPKEVERILLEFLEVCEEY